MTKPEERWARMRELFDGARTVPAMQRDAYLDRVCNDADMREEVAGLLQAHDTLESGQHDFLGVVDEERAAALLGRPCAPEASRTRPSAVTASFASSAAAGWASSISPTIRFWTGRWRSRYCRSTAPTM